MFTLSELDQIKGVLMNSTSLSDYEIQTALRDLQYTGTCNVRDMGQIEYGLARLPFVKLDSQPYGQLGIDHW